ncbi:MAG: prolipoprotein diacylglyceryl transferase [Synergistaceae bacterium]|nr:prolipoprotein diacylglyceryl transferase [Synergistaceae bacterium]
MYPVLFKISFIEVRSYYVLWTFALLVFILWTRNRAIRKFGMDWDDVSSVIVWIYSAAILGAIVGNAAEKLPLWLAGMTTADEILKGGLSSVPGMLCGGLAGVYRLRKLKISVDDFAEASSIPAAVMIGIGRIGCFLNGCCVGVGYFFAKQPWWAVYFPFDAAGFYRFPSQLSESAAGLMIALFLFTAERKIPEHDIKIGGSAILFPLFLILYGSYRLAFDSLRMTEPASALHIGQYISVSAIICGIIWLYRTYKIRRKEHGILNPRN